MTKTLLFAQCLVTADGVPALRANGIMKLGVPVSAMPEQPDFRGLVP